MSDFVPFENPFSSLRAVRPSRAGSELSKGKGDDLGPFFDPSCNFVLVSGIACLFSITNDG